MSAFLQHCLHALPTSRWLATVQTSQPPQKPVTAAVTSDAFIQIASWTDPNTTTGGLRQALVLNPHDQIYLRGCSLHRHVTAAEDFTTGQTAGFVAKLANHSYAPGVLLIYCAWSMPNRPEDSLVGLLRLVACITGGFLTVNSLVEFVISRSYGQPR